MLDGIEHLGTLCGMIRQARGLAQKDVSKQGGVNRGTIATFEGCGKISWDAFNRYVKGLGLSWTDRDILQRLFQTAEDIAEREQHLRSIRFSLLKNTTNRSCVAAVQALQSESFPCYIRDELQFVHAFNQSILDLFEITNDDLKSTWLAWHVIGTKYLPGSKLAQAHGNLAGGYFPQALKQFFVSAHKRGAG